MAAPIAAAAAASTAAKVAKAKKAPKAKAKAPRASKSSPARPVRQAVQQATTGAPAQSVARSVRNTGQLFWSVVLTVLTLALLSLLLRAASKNPKRVDQLFATLPKSLRTFVNPFGEPKATPAKVAPAPVSKVLPVNVQINRTRSMA